MTDCVSEMIRDLKKIAVHGRGVMVCGAKSDFEKPVWLGFDDADVQWFLHDHHTKHGRVINRLRKEYDDMLKAERFDRLYYWPFTKSQAKALLREIGARR